MRNSVLKSFAVSPLALLFVGCGSVEESQFIKDLKVRATLEKVSVDAEFSPKIPLNTEFSAPIKNFGTVRFVPASDTQGFHIAADLDVKAFVDTDLLLKQVNTLPNGQPFPSFVQGKLAHVSLGGTGAVKGNLYLGLEQGKRYLGAGAELTFMDSRFPSGIGLSQKLIDSNKREIGVVTIYGPKVEGGVTKIPGGVFIATNTSLFVGGKFNSAKLVSVGTLPYDRIDVSGKDSDKYQKPTAQFNLFKQFLEAGREAGVMN
jgi:hypothetical protein